MFAVVSLEIQLLEQTVEVALMRPLAGVVVKLKQDAWDSTVGGMVRILRPLLVSRGPRGLL